MRLFLFASVYYVTRGLLRKNHVQDATYLQVRRLCFPAHGLHAQRHKRVAANLPKGVVTIGQDILYDGVWSSH
jgi:hypothetical protein